MFASLNNFFEAISIFDLVYLVITILSLIKCSRKGFILSILAASKWLLAYVVTLILFPKFKPYTKDLIDNEYVLDITLGVGIFIVVIFVILLINKGISKAVSYSGLGSLDTIFGFFFGFLRGYIISVCIFSTVSIVYNHSKWPMKLDDSLTFSYVEKGSNYLIKEFPDKKNYEGFSPEKLNQLDDKPFEFFITSDKDIKKSSYTIITHTIKYTKKVWDYIKKKTKPPGRNPRIIQRNKDIQKAYYKLREEHGYTAKKVKEMLAEKYELTFSTIVTIHSHFNFNIIKMI